MKIKLVAFGIARDLIPGHITEIESDEIKSIGSLKEILLQKYEGFENLKQFRMAVNEEYQEDDYILKDSDEVIIIPPVSGG